MSSPAFAAEPTAAHWRACHGTEVHQGKASLNWRPLRRQDSPRTVRGYARRRAGDRLQARQAAADAAECGRGLAMAPVADCRTRGRARTEPGCREAPDGARGTQAQTRGVR